MGLKVTNNAFGTLNAGINSSATTIVLTAGQGARFPSLGAGDYFYATLIDTSNNLEIVKVTARSTDTMTVVRGQDGTTARAYSTNDRFELRPTAALFNEKADTADVTTLLAAKVSKTGDSMSGPLVIDAGGNNLQLTRATFNTFQLGIGTANGVNGLHLGNITAGTTPVSFDQGGRVLTPLQPAFSAIGTGTQSWSGGTNTQVINYTIKTGGIPTARAAGYDTSTKRFTAPVGGVYAFYHAYTITGAATGPESYLAVNGTNIYRMGVIGYLYSGGYFTATSFEVIYLNANDYVHVQAQNNNNVSFTIDLGRSYFGGYLIG